MARCCPSCGAWSPPDRHDCPCGQRMPSRARRIASASLMVLGATLAGASALWVAPILTDPRAALDVTVAWTLISGFFLLIAGYKVR